MLLLLVSFSVMYAASHSLWVGIVAGVALAAILGVWWKAASVKRRKFERRQPDHDLYRRVEWVFDGSLHVGVVRWTRPYVGADWELAGWALEPRSFDPSSADPMAVERLGEWRVHCDSEADRCEGAAITDAAERDSETRQLVERNQLAAAMLDTSRHR